jgi:hemerythrin-like metal-binding protein
VGCTAALRARSVDRGQSGAVCLREDCASSKREQLMAFEWMDRYKIGDSQIDAEHQEWFRLANTFLRADAEQSVQESGEAFSQYTRHHFFQEETLMREVEFPLTAIHVKEHDRLVGTLEKIRDVVDKDVLSKEELEGFVGYCLVQHIANFDAPFSTYIRRKGLAAVV